MIDDTSPLIVEDSRVTDERLKAISLIWRAIIIQAIVTILLFAAVIVVGVQVRSVRATQAEIRQTQEEARERGYQSRAASCVLLESEGRVLDVCQDPEVRKYMESTAG